MPFFFALTFVTVALGQRPACSPGQVVAVDRGKAGTRCELNSLRWKTPPIARRSASGINSGHDAAVSGLA